jgi:hypothetical protein
MPAGQTGPLRSATSAGVALLSVPLGGEGGKFHGSVTNKFVDGNDRVMVEYHVKIAADIDSLCHVLSAILLCMGLFLEKTLFFTPPLVAQPPVYGLP